MKAVIHCSDSPQGRGDNAETIHNWHLANGWDGIGYHYVILENGVIESGRPKYWQGAHCRGYNEDIGICLIGIDTFSEIQYNSLRVLLKSLNIRIEDIKGHYEHDTNKTCPNIDMDWFRATLH